MDVDERVSNDLVQADPHQRTHHLVQIRLLDDEHYGLIFSNE